MAKKVRADECNYPVIFQNFLLNDFFITRHFSFFKSEDFKPRCASYFRGVGESITVHVPLSLSFSTLSKLSKYKSLDTIQNIKWVVKCSTQIQLFCCIHNPSMCLCINIVSCSLLKIPSSMAKVKKIN